MDNASLPPHPFLSRAFCCWLPLVGLAPVCLAQTPTHVAEIVNEAGVRGGLAVWVARKDTPVNWADALGELHTQHSFLVLGLHPDAPTIDSTRAELAKHGVVGAVTVDTFVAPDLPLIDESVNLLVISDAENVERDGAKTVSEEELMRVLAPRGVLLRLNPESGIKSQKSVKPVPDAIDDWTHYLHDASNNAVSHDTRVAPPRRLQWQCGPRWSRHHDHMASVSALVSAAGRVFYILDEGSRVSPQFPSDWQLVARDAFNGIQLWKRPIPDWHTQLWPLKSGPANLPRRLVAVGDVVYATLGLSAPVTAMKAASGDAIRTYRNTESTEEILLQDGVLLALVNRTPIDFDADLADDPEKGGTRDRRTTHSPTISKLWAGIRSKRWTHGDRVVRAFRADTGEMLWEKPSTVLPLTLGADDTNVYFHDNDKILALALITGEERWTSEPVPVWKGMDGRGLQSWFAPTLVAQDGKVLFAGGEKTHMSYMGWGSKDIGQDTMTVLSAADGKKLWTAPSPFSGYNSPEDLFVSNGKAWMGSTAKGGGGGRYVGHDLATGEMTADYPPTVQTHWFHHRCHRAKATDKYILSSRTGIEFVDLATGEWTINHWVRGGCLYGIMPANGLIYSPPNPCACYPESKLYGFTAVAPPRAIRNDREPQSSPRLEKGPAFGSFGAQQSGLAIQSDWPMYRCDPARSGAISADVPATLTKAWEIDVGGRLTQPVSSGGLLIVADVDRHTVHAMSASTGEKVWSYVAGGRIDSAPTCWRGRVLFGSADGSVTCLRDSDGALAWRFRAVPGDRRMIAFDQVESVWPIPGSVLVQDGVATVVAGRSMFLDGGLRLCRIGVETGELLGEKTLDEHDPIAAEEATLQSRIKGLNMPVAMPDILSSDGQHLYMRSQTMDLAGNRTALGPGKTGPDHLFAPYGFTDDSWFHRSYWLFGDAFIGGVGGYRNGQQKPAGRILVNSDTTVFGYGRDPQYYRWCSALEYQLYAAPRPGNVSSPAVGTVRAVLFENTPSLNPTNKPITVAAWLKPGSDDGTILVRGANKIGFALILTDRKPRMLVRTGGKTHEAVGTKRIGTDWAHVAGVLHAEGRMQVFVDGEAVGETSGVPLLDGDPMIPMKIGYDDINQLLPDPLAPFNGALDEVMLFHRALSPDGIKRLATAGAKLAGEDTEGLVLHLPFTGGTVRDASGADNHGKSNGSAVATVEGPVGPALVLNQSANLVPAATPQKKSGSKFTYRWVREIAMMVRAMALANDVLFVAGPADVLDETAAFQAFDTEASQELIVNQDAAFRGKSGALFDAIDANTGETLAEYTLPTTPVFDGLSVASGRVYIALSDGRLIAFSEAARP